MFAGLAPGAWTRAAGVRVRAARPLRHRVRLWPATITAFSGKPKDRTIEKGKAEDLKFHFQKNKIPKTGYDITVSFTNGCSVHIAN